MPAIILLVGLPGSGKSTWTRAFLSNASTPWVVLDTDSMIEHVASQQGLTYTQAFSRVDLDALTRQFFENMDHALAAGENVIVDRTNLTPQERANILARIPANYTKKAVIFNVDKRILESRLATRAATTGKHIPPDVIDKMRQSYIAPTREDFDDIIGA